MKCYCGSGKAYAECCAPLIEGMERAPDAETLMRSRYSAYVTGAGEYLVATTVPEKRVAEDAALIREHAAQTAWLRLDVLASGQTGEKATVEFKAYYKEGDGMLRVHHEKSFFDAIAGEWFYQEGTLYEASVGRNDPCPCGSGRKYKKCCGARA